MTLNCASQKKNWFKTYFATAGCVFLGTGCSTNHRSQMSPHSLKLDEKTCFCCTAVFLSECSLTQCSSMSAADLMLACDGIARLVEGIPRFPWGNAGGMGFWGLHGPLLLFFLCFLVSAGGLVFLRGFRCCCCWCCTRRLTSPRRKLSFGGRIKDSLTWHQCKGNWTKKTEWKH